MTAWLHVCVRPAVVGWGETHLARLQITIKYLFGLGLLRLGAVVAVPVPVGDQVVAAAVTALGE